MRRSLQLLLILITLSFAGTFERAVEWVIYEEGDSTYCHDGGFESKFGISKQWHPQEDIKHLTRARAIEIYKCDYWEVIGAYMRDSVFAWIYFDCSVLLGPPTAVIMARDCYDPGILMWKYRCALQKEIVDHPKKAVFFGTWTKRLSELNVASGLNEGKTK